MTRVALVAVALFIDGCSSNDAAPVGDAATTADLTFEKDIVPIFERSCGSKDNECHSRVAFHPNKDQGCRGWLALENAAIGDTVYAGPDEGKPTGCPNVGLYERLTTLDAWECGPPYFEKFPRRKYIDPGKPEASHLYNKMVGTPQCGIPNVMPKGGKADPNETETIRRWIAAGAPRAK